MNETQQLAQFAVQLRYADLPSAVVEKAQEIALHAWGLQLAGSTLPLSRAIFRHMRTQGGAPQSTVLNYGMKTTTANAAFLNGTFGHGFEMDDNHAQTSVKGGCVVVPTALAMGEHQLSTGKDFILSIVAGFEIMTRVAMSVTPVLMQRGHHATGTCGPFGAATTAGKLLGFDEKTMVHALSAAAACAGGLVEAPASGRGDLKRTFGGMAAANGIRSAYLAQLGMTGPITNIEGERGFCRAYGDQVNMPALTAGLGNEWQILRVHYKVYAQDGFVQPMTEALERIVSKHSFALDEIEEVKVGASKEAQYWAGEIREPRDVTSAQFSANFSLALFLVKRRVGFMEYNEETLRDPTIIELSKKVRMEVDDEVEQEFRKVRSRGARVTVTLRSGQSFSELVPSLRALSAQEVTDKFRQLATLAIGAQQCEQLESIVRALPDLSDMSTLAPLLTRGGL